VGIGNIGGGVAHQWRLVCSSVINNENGVMTASAAPVSAWRQASSESKSGK